MTTRTHRRRLAAASALAVAASAAALATTGSAQTAPTTLHLVSHSQKGVGFSPAGAPRQGDRLGFGDAITGDDSGTDTAVCTVMRHGALCTIEVRLSKGTLSAQGLLPQRSSNSPVAITGGTGAYAGASGTAVVSDTSPSSSTIVVTLTS